MDRRCPDLCRSHPIRIVTGSGTPTAGSTDATLSGLTASTSTSASGTYTALSIGTFASATTSYTATVANARTHLKLTPAVTDSSATVKVGKGTSLTAVTSGSASGAIALSVGSNEVKVEVTAADTTTKKTYTVTVTRQTAAPTVPRNVQVTPGDGKLTIAWQAPSSWGSWPAKGYVLEARRSVGGQIQVSTFQSVVKTAGGTSSFFVPGVSDTSFEFTGSQSTTGTVSNIGAYTVTNGASYDLRIQAWTQQPGIDGTQDSHFLLSSWVTINGQTPQQAPSPGAIVSETVVSMTAGSTATYTVVLDTAPAANVTTGATSGATDKATVTPATRTFTSSNWNTPQTFTVRGVAAGSSTITHAVTTTTVPAYNAITIDPVSATVSAADDSDLLTGLTIYDGTQFLRFEPNSAYLVGFVGRYAFPIYTVHVAPGVHSVTVTPTWTNTDITGITGTVRHTTYGMNGATANWSSNESGTGETVRVMPSGHRASHGATELKLEPAGVEGGSYRIFLVHNMAWKAADERLKKDGTAGRGIGSPHDEDHCTDFGIAGGGVLHRGASRGRLPRPGAPRRPDPASRARPRPPPLPSPRRRAAARRALAVRRRDGRGANARRAHGPDGR